MRRRTLVGTLVAALVAGIALPAAGGPEPRPLAADEMLRGRFVQERVLTGFSKPLRSEGSFLLVAGRGLVWRAEKPFRSTTVITAGGILQLVDGAETMRLPASRAPLISRFYDVLSGALSGDRKELARAFRIEAGEAEGKWTLLLTPSDASDPALGLVQSIRLVGAELVDAVEIRKEGGDLDRLSFRDQMVEPLRLDGDEQRLLEAIAR